MILKYRLEGLRYRKQILNLLGTLQLQLVYNLNQSKGSSKSLMFKKILLNQQDLKRKGFQGLQVVHRPS